MSPSPLRPFRREGGGLRWGRVLLVVLVAIGLLGAAFVGALSLYADSLYRGSYESTYEYRASFASNQSLSNLTVYVPVPVENGSVRVVGTNVTASSFDETTPPDAPPVTARVVDTERGQMLALSADEFPVRNRYYRFVEEGGEGRRVPINASEYDPQDPDTIAYTERSVQVEVRVRVTGSVDTRDPVGTEPLPSTASDYRPHPCRDDSPFDTQRCYGFESQVFRAYDGPPQTRTSVWVEVAGRNEWWVFGWNGNQYQAVVHDETFGAAPGWRTVTGELETGWGNYRGDPPASNRTAAHAPA